MEIEINKDTNNTVIGRREIEFYIVGENKTPSIDDVRAALCKKLNLSPDSTAIVKVSQSFGLKRCFALANSYKDQESMKKFEKKYLFARMEKKAKKKASAEAAAPKEEAPAPEKAKAEA
ncbi:MAG: hypothetical protein M1504_00410 [Candidatus Marsarchaeota archaeon]|nr:hypothetical protein [Candidatus Marsarchaeota archaeon]